MKKIDLIDEIAGFLKRNQKRLGISDLTLDGDHKSAEVIFKLDEGEDRTGWVCISTGQWTEPDIDDEDDEPAEGCFLPAQKRTWKIRDGESS